MTHAGSRTQRLWLIVLLLLLCGATLRLYFVAAHSAFMQSDEAIVGLMAKHILTRGQFPIFFHGEEWNGALIAYLVAPFFYLFGVSNLVFKAVTMAVSLVFALLVYLLAKRIGGEKVALLALVLTVFGSPFFIMWSVHASGQYLVMMVCGVGSLLLCDDILFSCRLNAGQRSTLRRHITYGLLGFVMGVGFWTSPSVVSFIGAIWIVLWLRDRKCFFQTTFLAFLVCFIVGNLPGLLFNALPGLRSAAGLPGTPDWVSYTLFFTGSTESIWARVLQIPNRLFQVVTVSMPVMVGGSLWEYETDLLRRSIVVVLMTFWTLALIYTLAARVRLWSGRKGKRRWKLTPIDAPILQFLLTFLIFAFSQYGWLVREPRYLLPAFAFFPIAGACFMNWLHARRSALGYSVLSLVVVLNLATSIWFSESLDPDHGLWPKDEELIQYLIDNKIYHPIANYWIAYSIAFESDERVIPVPIGYRRITMYADVLNGPAPNHYLFRKGGEDDRYFQFFRYGLSGPQWTAASFDNYLREIDVPASAYEAREFERYVLFDVPNQYLDSTEISSPDVQLSEDYFAQASRYLVGVARLGDALILNPPALAAPLSQKEMGGVATYLVPEQVPLDGGKARDRLAGLASKHDRLFVLLGDTSSSDPGGFVEGWLNRHAFRADDRWIGDLRFVLYGTPDLLPAEVPSQMEGSIFGEWIELTGTDLPIAHAAPGDIVPVTLFWQAQQPVEKDFKVFVHLLNSGGQLVAQRDSEAVGGLRPTSTWAAGESIVDRHGVLLPDDLPAGDYQLVVGLYDAATGSRLPAVVEKDALPSDFLLVGIVYVGP